MFYSSAQAYWRLCFASGIVILVLSAVIFAVFPQEMADPTIEKTPVYAFEFARSPQDLEAIFGGPDDPLRGERIRQMDLGNKIDFAYMLVYSFFISTFFAALYKQEKRKHWILLSAMGLLAGLADFSENLILLQITQDIEAAASLSLLWLPVHIKFTALYICGFGVGFYLLQLAGKASKGLGILQMLLAVAAILILFSEGGEEGTIAIVLAWLTQLVLAGRYVFRPKA